MSDRRPRTPTAGELLFVGLLWLVAGYVAVGGLGFRYPANVAPALLGGAAFVLLSWLIVGYMRGALAARRSPVASPSSASPLDGTLQAQVEVEVETAGELAPPAAEASDDAHEPAVLAWILATAAALVLLGFLVGVTVALIGLFRVHGRESWPVTLLATLLVQATLFIAFGIFLRVPFFPGLLVQLLP